MKRKHDLLERRKQFIADYLKQNKGKQMKVIILELEDRLFISERSLYVIINEIKREEFNSMKIGKRVVCKGILYPQIKGQEFTIQGVAESEPKICLKNFWYEAKDFQVNSKVIKSKLS